jgi:hypothetical protein
MIIYTTQVHPSDVRHFNLIVNDETTRTTHLVPYPMGCGHKWVYICPMRAQYIYTVMKNVSVRSCSLNEFMDGWMDG